MFHLELFSSSIATGANTFAQLTYIQTDAILPGLNLGVQVSPDLPFLMAVAGVGVNLVHVRAQANSMLPFPWPTLSPNNRGGAFESPPRLWDYSDEPIPLKPTEEMDIFATQNAAGAQVEYVAAIFSNGVQDAVGVPINPSTLPLSPVTPGRFFTAHLTASTTLVAGAFTSVQPTFDQTLPAGTYALVGARAFSATGLFFRMLPSMGPKWRPGGVMVQAYDQLDAANQRFQSPFNLSLGGWGRWMTFFQNVPPKVEVYATAADVAEEFWYDLVYLSPQTTLSI